METKQETEPRYEGTNWDNPVVKVKRCGASHSALQRKVLTRGVKTLYVGGTVKHVKELLRQGLEVRLADELGNDAIRIFPLATTDCKSMTVHAQVMGAFKKCLADKKLRIRHGEHEIAREKVDELMQEQEKRYRAPDPEFEAVTPDTIVKCPQCGYRFRVGRSMKE